jgi:hypothetical protein
MLTQLDLYRMCVSFIFYRIKAALDFLLLNLHLLPVSRFARSLSVTIVRAKGMLLYLEALFINKIASSFWLWEFHVCQVSHVS